MSYSVYKYHNSSYKRSLEYVPEHFCYSRDHRYRYGDYAEQKVDCPWGLECC